jgi:hypothetical protein
VEARNAIRKRAGVAGTGEYVTLSEHDIFTSTDFTVSLFWFILPYCAF